MLTCTKCRGVDYAQPLYMSKEGCPMNLQPVVFWRLVGPSFDIHVTNPERLSSDWFAHNRLLLIRTAGGRQELNQPLRVLCPCRSSA